MDTDLKQTASSVFPDQLSEHGLGVLDHGESSSNTAVNVVFQHDMDSRKRVLNGGRTDGAEKDFGAGLGLTAGEEFSRQLTPEQREEAGGLLNGVGSSVLDNKSRYDMRMDK